MDFKKCFLIKYYLAIKRNEGLIHATTWMNFEHIMPSDRSQAKKKKGHILYDSVYVKYLEYVNIETDRLMITTSWEEERIESNCLVGKGIYSGLIEKF